MTAKGRWGSAEVPVTFGQGSCGKDSERGMGEQRTAWGIERELSGEERWAETWQLPREEKLKK